MIVTTSFFQGLTHDNPSAQIYYEILGGEAQWGLLPVTWKALMKNAKSKKF